jgi:SAM-dependent methyltransferase
VAPAVSRTLESTIRRLEERAEALRPQFSEGFARFAERHDLTDWEGWFSPYDDQIYDAVLSHIGPEDTVLDLGAGDLRLALRMAGQAQKVYAVEVNPLLLSWALEIIGLDLPRNLHVICANALDLPIPSDVTVAVLLMRHCQHFHTYVGRLQAASCQRLVTNARWRAGVELINLSAHGISFDDVREGWYACRCGATGYVGTGERSNTPPAEVDSCPACSDSMPTSSGRK